MLWRSLYKDWKNFEDDSHLKTWKGLKKIQSLNLNLNLWGMNDMRLIRFLFFEVEKPP